MGVITVDWAAEYFRLAKAPTRAAVRELADDGLLAPVDVEGLAAPAWRWHAARLPRKVAARALVCPFDPLLFDRRRLREVFGTDYRIEIYVPAAQRQHGYYVYCLLLGERIAARVDLKADRAAGLLRVQAAWAEPNHPAARPEVLDALVAELQAMAKWLELGGIVAAPVGDLGAELAYLLG